MQWGPFYAPAITDNRSLVHLSGSSCTIRLITFLKGATSTSVDPLYFLQTLWGNHNFLLSFFAASNSSAEISGLCSYSSTSPYFSFPVGYPYLSQVSTWVGAGNRGSSFATLGQLLLGLPLGGVGTGPLDLLDSPLSLSAHFSFGQLLLKCPTFPHCQKLRHLQLLKNDQPHRMSSTSEILFLLGPPCLISLQGSHCRFPNAYSSRAFLCTLPTPGSLDSLVSFVYYPFPDPLAIFSYLQGPPFRGHLSRHHHRWRP
ncbi:unnamed protein product [Acanthosepion pharaonis]|uniref:Uncharacterized protein n=1 Tax=Acanthosepion pharaonis TaxID=158019 RepID=A0A812DQS7_ACAPH|nr:unnamed protein product [Sepia pharaonis]